MKNLQPSDVWSAWIQQASVVGRSHVLGGDWKADGEHLWADMLRLLDTTDDMSGYLQCVVSCLGGVISPEPLEGDSGLIQQVFWPTISAASLDVDDTVAWPALEEEIDEMFFSERVQAAVLYVNRIIDVLETRPEPDEELLDCLLVGSEVLSPPPGYDV
jgi:hypothetical protein